MVNAEGRTNAERGMNAELGTQNADLGTRNAERKINVERVARNGKLNSYPLAKSAWNAKEVTSQSPGDAKTPRSEFRLPPSEFRCSSELHVLLFASRVHRSELRIPRFKLRIPRFKLRAPSSAFRVHRSPFPSRCLHRVC